MIVPPAIAGKPPIANLAAECSVVPRMAAFQDFRPKAAWPELRTSTPSAVSFSAS